MPEAHHEIPAVTHTNIDHAVVRGFGEEWTRFDQSDLDATELTTIAERYFAIFPWEQLSRDATGFDLGCGSGRWAKFVAPRVGELHCIDASEAALAVARRNLSGEPNVHFHHASVGALPLPRGSQDFGYSLGVLHHVPDPAAGLRDTVTYLKPGAPFLVYLYYAFDNRPAWFRAIWRASDVVRRGVARLPAAPRHLVADVLAAAVYFPLARLARAVERLGIDVRNMPLAAYRDHSFYVMRTDSLDRFGTRVE